MFIILISEVSPFIRLELLAKGKRTTGKEQEPKLILHSSVSN
jgi:hypothetical protein